MKLIDLLKEIGDATARPYEWQNIRDDKDSIEYEFKTDSDLRYILEIMPQEDEELRDSAIVEFGITTGEHNYFKDFEIITNEGELYKVMSTVVAILKDFIKKHKEIKHLVFITENIRTNLYIHYIKKQLPNAKIHSKSKKDQNTVIIDLKEIGDATAKPYEWETWSGYEDDKEYGFETDSGLNYKLEIAFQETDSEKDSAALSFGIVDKESDYSVDYEAIPSKGELYKVMATVVDILKDFIKNYPEVRYLYFSTNKQQGDQSSRLKLYMKYIQSQIPNAKIYTKDIDGEEATYITLK